MPECPEGPATKGDGTSAATGTIHVPQPEQLDSVHWAPDGKHLLLSGGGVELLDSSADLLISIPGAETATWVDSQTYATGSNCQSGSGVGSVTIHHIDGPSQTLPGTFDTTEMLGSGHGALALAPRLVDVGADPTTSMIWANSELGAPIEGAPLGWAPSGARLLVAKGGARGGSTGSAASVRIALVDYPSLDVITSFSDFVMDPRYEPIFSPDGRKIAVSCGPVTAVGQCQQYVLDSETGQSRAVAAQPAGLPLSWLANGRLLLGPVSYGQAGRLREWDGVSTLTSTLPPASWGVTSSNGSVALETMPIGDGGTTTILDAAAASTAELPGAIGLYWSPDGAKILLRIDPTQDLVLVSVN